MRTFALQVILLLVASEALAGEVDLEASIDVFRGESVLGDDRQSGQELGHRLRLDLLELSDRLEVHIDYRGREPIGGDFENAALRLLYRGEVGFHIIDDTLFASLGRFIAPSAILLPVDGARVVVKPATGLSISAFGGRRAISTSRKNIDFDRFLPAAGGNVSYRWRWLDFDATAAFAKDDAFAFSGEGPRSLEYDALNLYFRGTARPFRGLTAGAYVSLVDQAAFTLGPGWSTIDVEVETLGLFSALGFVDYRPLPMLRFAIDGQYQSVQAFRARTLEAGDIEVKDEAPKFFDARWSGAYRALDRGWVRARVRARRRGDRTELRFGGALDVDDLGLAGVYMRTWLTFEDVRFDEDAVEKPDLDRILWSAALGYRGFDLDVQGGARFIDRRALPLSGRADNPEAIEDLAPFVLEAQRIAFLRAFYSPEHWFAGVDFEMNIEDPSETRVLVQVGTFLEASW